MKKAKPRTAAQRSAAAKQAWAARRARGIHKLPLAELPHVAESFKATFAQAAVPERTNIVQGYETLERELHAAYDQSANGKGKERHANGRPFHRQPIMENGRMFGPGFTAGQAAKKAQEALGMVKRDQKDAAIAELHGAIVYLAATAALIRES